MTKEVQLHKKWAWIGLLIAAIGFMGLWFFQQYEKNSPLESFVKMLPYPIVVAYVAFIGPFIEEIAFRSWAIGKLWINIIGFIMIQIFLWVSLYEYYYLIIPISGLIFYVFFYKKPSLSKTVLLTITLSCVFGIIHIYNVSHWGSKIGYAVYTTGIGLVLCYVSLRFKFIYAVIIHMLFNGVQVLFSNDLKSSLKDTYVIETEAFSIQLQKNENRGNNKTLSSSFDSSNSVNSLQFENYSISNTLLDLSFMQPQNEVKFSTSFNFMEQTYNGFIKSKKNSGIQLHELILTLKNHEVPIHLDTILIPLYELHFNGDNIDSGMNNTTIEIKNLIKLLNEQTNNSFYLISPNPDSNIFISFNRALKNSVHVILPDGNELKALEENGFSIRKTDTLVSKVNIQVY